MPGYQLLENSSLATARRNGIPPHAQAIGLLDFLRDLEEDEFPFARFAELRVVGLEEVLYAARPEDEVLALEIHRRLRAAAQDLEARLLSVQVVFSGKLIRGDTLWSDYRSHRLPVGHVFGSPPPETDAHGNRFYRTNFNLTQA